MGRSAAARWLDALIERPWRLVLVVALVIAIPILVLGEVAASDTRARVHAVHLEPGPYDFYQDVQRWWLAK